MLSIDNASLGGEWVQKCTCALTLRVNKNIHSVGNNRNNVTNIKMRMFEHDENEDRNSKGILATCKMMTRVKMRTYAEVVRKQNSKILRTQMKLQN